jgi:nicotinamidase-related amidase
MSALIIVDCQHDFITGSLAVKGAQEILPVVYDLLDNHTWDVVVATQVGLPSARMMSAR